MSKGTWAGLVIGLVLLTIGAAYLWYAPPRESAERAAEVLPTPEVAAAPVETPLPEPSAMPAEPVAELPMLEESDPTVRDALVDAFGAPPVEAYLLPDRIVRRFVATVDSLDTDPVRAKSRPLAPVEGRLLVEKVGDTILLSPRNAERYEAYISALQAADTAKIASVYLRYYPLFQRAYEELGYPKRSFNDRFIAIIDHLLEAPTPPEPVELVRPKVVYQFDDAQLESLSWGQKTLVRIGTANAATVKSKLRELRAAIVGQPAAR
ncbi:MAG: DUF3014 domain-containing protein [Sinimarinibacterium sp.]|jgi:hypothetical protein